MKITLIILAGLLAACSAQPTESGAGGAHFDANCLMRAPAASSARLSCITVITNSSPTTATPTSTITPTVTVPVSAAPSIP